MQQQTQTSPTLADLPAGTETVTLDEAEQAGAFTEDALPVSDAIAAANDDQEARHG